MCGIVGIIKKKNQPLTEPEFNDFLVMLEQAQYRGREATGVMFLMEDGTIRSMKAPLKAETAIDFIPYRKNIRGIFGHTRASTGGSPKENENNHPHESENWILIHNGVVGSTLKYKDMDLKTRCDTEEFVATFEYVGKEKFNSSLPLAEQIKKSFPLLKGSWSLAFIHKPSKRIFLTTNGGSPLHVCYTENSLMFASVSSYFDQTFLFKQNKETEQKAKLSKHIIPIHDWKPGIETSFFQPFSPQENMLLELAEDCTLLDCGTYTIKSKSKYTYEPVHHNTLFGDNDHHWRHGYCTDYGNDYYRGTVDYAQKKQNTNDWWARNKNKSKKIIVPCLLTEVEWFEHFGKKKENYRFDITFTEMAHYFSMNTPKFDVKAFELNICYEFSETMIKSFAMDILNNDFYIFGLEKDVADKFIQDFFRQKMKKPSKKIMKIINKKFSEEIIDNLLDEWDYLDPNGEAIPSQIKEILDTDQKLTSLIYDAIEWYERILIIRYGIEFEQLELTN